MFAPRRPSGFLRLIALILFAAAIGCGDDSGQDDSNHTGRDASLADAMADAADAGADAAPFTCLDPAPTSASEPQEIAINRWMVGAVSGGDQVGAALESGAFEMPIAGEDKYGAQWLGSGADEDGAIDLRGATGRIYAAARVRVDEPTVVMARLDNLWRIYVNDTLQTGDIYGHRNKRVPLALDAGVNTIVAQFSDQRTPVRVELFETPDALAFNTLDTTHPDLLVDTATKLPLGLPVLNLSGETTRSVTARVVENEYFEATAVEYPSLAADAVTQIGFQLQPKAAWEAADQTIPVTLRIESCSLPEAYETEIELNTVGPDTAYRRTFVSPVDASVQYYGVLPPSNYEPGRQYALALSLHGAGVKGIKQAGSYSQKDWAYVIAPTNRRRFGFNWEQWGRLNGLAALDHAMSIFSIDPTSVYVTGHSMGGHGTWHFGVMNPGRFATVGPSAGWGSVYTYAGASRPSGTVARARAHSDTHHYVSNLADRGAYIIHGSADNNVPVSEGRTMRDEISQHSDDVVYHEEPGARHWWDGDAAEGADCVDWPPLWEFMKDRRLDPYELEFRFMTPGPYYSAEHSYVTIQSRETPMEDAVLESAAAGESSVELTTANVRAMDIDGAALRAQGLTEIVVDGTTHQLSDGVLELGPREGKRLGVTGPLNQVFEQPFCFVYPDEGSPKFREYAAYLLSVWSLRGNGHGCALPMSRVDETLRAERNLIYLGVPADQLPDAANRPFGWDDSTITIGEWDFEEAAATIVFPVGDRISAAFVTTEGEEYLLFRYRPFSSVSNVPDYFVWAPDGGMAAGYFDNDWRFDAALGGRR